MNIRNTQVYGFEGAKWFSDCDVGIRFKNNVFEVNLTMGNQVTKYVGRFKTIDEARIHRKQFLIDLFVSNLHKNNIINENIKEISFIENYFVCKEGYILNKFGNPLKGMTDRCGYKEINIKGRNYLVHRLVLREFNPNENFDKLDVNHIDGNKENNKLENLEWCTRSENIIHSFKNGLQNNVAGKLIVNEDILNEFIKYRNMGYTYKEIAEITSYHERTIRKHIANQRKRVD